LKDEVVLPMIDKHEPLLIHQISHGGRCGEVEAGDILDFAKKLGVTHPIALTNGACYSSDLLAKTLLHQQKNPTHAYIDHFCLMTLSPFSHAQIELDDEESDGSTATFIKGMEEAAPGKSFADYLREHNYYVDLIGQKRPLGLSSAANWEEMGLVDYLAAGEDIFYFTRPYALTNFGKSFIDSYVPVLSFKKKVAAATAQDVKTALRIKLAAKFVNRVNTLLNQAREAENSNPHFYANHEFLYYAANHLCQNLTEIRAAQVCLPKFHLTKAIQDSGGMDYNQARANWQKTCAENEGIGAVLRAWKMAPAAMKEQFEKGFVAAAAKMQATCAQTACDDIATNGQDNCIIIAAEQASSPEDFIQQKAAMLAKIREEQSKMDYVSLLQKRLKEEGGITWSLAEITTKLNDYYAANHMDPAAQTVDCAKSYEKYFTYAAWPKEEEIKADFQEQCTNLYHHLGQQTVAAWPPLPTNYASTDIYADYLAQILLGAIDITEQIGLGLNGKPASNGDYLKTRMMEVDVPFSPTHDIILEIHNIMDVALRTPPSPDFPLDQKRRQACENFKLGGIAAQ
ncbi:MAG: hypothetical protein J6Y94_06265, partial [Bacteriovoracaceae bacterium]|nr:hypothetical protein [Bacteriovoracaceae bacterium]